MSQRIYHRQFVELGISGPGRVPKLSGEPVLDPSISVFQDRCYWLQEGMCQVAGLREWASTAQPGDRFIWMNPLDAADGGGTVYVCVRLWYEEE